MPLAWAHAEYVKLARSLRDGRVFDTPPETVHRYLKARRACSRSAWRFNNKARSIDAGHSLRIEVQAPVTVHWSGDDWATTMDVDATDTTLGIWAADLPTERMAPGDSARFTFYWPEARRWEGADFAVQIRGSH